MSDAVALTVLIIAMDVSHLSLSKMQFEDNVFIRPSFEAYIATFMCFLLALFAWGSVFYGHSVYMHALQQHHQWSTSLISGAILAFWLASLPGSLLLGAIIGRIGPAFVVFLGGVITSFSLWSLGQAEHPWHIYVSYILLGFCYPSVGAAAISVTLSSYFQKGFGLALGIAFTGASVGGTLFPPSMTAAILAYGFPQAMMMLGILVGLAITLSSFGMYLIRKPANHYQPKDSNVWRAFSNLVSNHLFWKVAVPVSLGLGAQVGFLAHQIPIMLERVDLVQAAYSVSLLALISTAGRLLVGLMVRQISPMLLASICYGAHGLGITFLYLADGIVASMMAVLMVGTTVGAIVILPPLITRHVLGIQIFPQAFALVNIFMYACAGLGPWIVGLLHDFFEGYGVALIILALVQALAMWRVFQVRNLSASQ